MDFQFLPLELWRASSLAQETKTVIAAYERCLASGDLDGLAALRRAIERRIDDLEAFYLSNVDDERSVLFEKQRLKLRKLLHEYDAAVAATGSSAGLHVTHMAGSSGYASGGGMGMGMDAAHTHGYGRVRDDVAGVPIGGDGMGGIATRTIREDTRLVLPELLSWFSQAGVAEMPEVTPEIVERVYTSVTRTNIDGKMSVRDLRQWYITFGKRALREGLPLDSIVSQAFVSRAGVATAAKKAALTGEPLASSGMSVTAPTASRKTLYPWEVAGTGKTSGEEATPVAVSGGPLVVPNGMVEFQVRLTPEEFHAVQMRRRALEAEAKYKQRVDAAKAKAAAMRGERPTGDGEYGVASLITTGPYVEPASKDQYFYRSP